MKYMTFVHNESLFYSLFYITEQENIAFVSKFIKTCSYDPYALFGCFILNA